jgi:U3 small nucleolar RNA-associated protein 13
VLQKLAHAKGITDVCVSPNDALLCTASLDKTCKVWAVSLAGRRPGLELVAELRGHRRAVNSVAFSARDRVVCTASADCTVKVWAVPEGRCVRTLEGHAAPVTQALFLAGGTSLVSAAADGALKTWDLKSSLCAQTSAAHQDKVWALALAPGPGEARLCSVGEGGELVLWRDSSEEEAARRFEQSRALVVERDALDRAVRERDFDTASRLALKLDRPHQLRTLLAGAPVGDVQRLVAGLVLACDKDRLAMLLKHVAAWNSQARSCVVAQQVLRVLLLQADGLAERLGRHVLQDFCDRVLPYTARHQARFDKLLRASYVIDHAVDLGN